MTGKPHVVFVDDEPRILDGLRRMLRREGARWDMSFAAGGAEALALMESRGCNVVVSDFRMPNMDGGQLLSKVQTLYPATARVILSGQTGEKDVLRVISLAHQFLTKPAARDQLVQTVDRLIAAQAASGDESARRDVSMVDSLPSPPGLVVQLISALNEEDPSPESVGAIIEQDPAAAAKVLHLVNSSASMVSNVVSDVVQAVVMLGTHTVRGLVLMHAVVRGLDPGGVLSTTWIQEVTDHSVHTSRLARQLAGAAPWADAAFTAGLLHEVGQLVLASSRPESYPDVLRSWRDKSAPGTEDGPNPALDDVERAGCGTCHSEAGANLLTLWGLTPAVVDAVARHAGLEASPTVVDPSSAVALAHHVVEAELGPICGGSVESSAEVEIGPREREVIERWRATARR
ncbi:HDOD domain-containing protein [Actinoplanes sp. NBRC 103695]|uniref:HDOD domain-containing protein n=1 Tax=Actinoplanes sp. NBRC 103695 TaxID=3032202 RepID=UPI0024A5CA7D|nr:HDOD domain-containing protein [Actinoplanes sp. NBRC 103695]GLY92947.1 two-component system response regulator [Actinoplanes sp. NBRC 103695]